VRGRRLLGAVRELWETRDELARERDVSPGRIIGDSAIVAAALAMPTTRSELLGTRGFHGRGAQRYSDRWLEALERASTMPEDDLPVRAPRTDGPPTPRAWAERDPVAAARLTLARDAITRLSDEVGVPAENLVSPDTVRRVMWTPPLPDMSAVADRLASYGARAWQVELVTPLLVDAIAGAEPVDEPEAPTDDEDLPADQPDG